MKVLITGGAGFIGSHLARFLIEKNDEVYIIDSLHSYYSQERKREHIKEIKNAGFFYFYEMDLLDREKTISTIKEIAPDTIIHLAALPGVSYSIAQPNEYVDYDIKATINVLEAAGQAGVKKVIFASSSSVYGNSEGPCKEEMAAGKVISPYAASKYAAESFCHVYEHLYGYKMIILRFFTVYGPWGRPDMAITGFIKKLLNAEAVTVFGEGSARDYTYIDDIVNGINLSIEKLQSSEIINLGSGNPISMEELLAELKGHFSDMKVKREGSRKGDVDKTWADIGKAEQLLGYKPEVSFSDGISETVKWAKKNESIL
ncbi:SDR family NAD(P)-dependent oxidoreductase [Bacillus sp. ISL-47]|uniref:SDR family NAD(P)-dependent oxidoreductase n=1 Tax=Bacillus sp. ISL-47 TaxID=2819130 RepID=UPI001BED0B28|nr:SDR family NAD(P)-dependent oxidoreductase [Bacillus sp. ISL-47]MBT2688150.1 SDR family NAD(P)-dependent oxidoreductase [Bacillus sp. ISL-47]MBT2707592.1 SDR family NAD(P)-dependent oxidoreductase [Pseudomonas sp. ISL-84]